MDILAQVQFASVVKWSCELWAMYVAFLCHVSCIMCCVLLQYNVLSFVVIKVKEVPRILLTLPATYLAVQHQQLCAMSHVPWLCCMFHHALN